VGGAEDAADLGLASMMLPKLRLAAPCAGRWLYRGGPATARRLPNAGREHHRRREDEDHQGDAERGWRMVVALRTAKLRTFVLGREITRSLRSAFDDPEARGCGGLG